MRKVFSVSSLIVGIFFFVIFMVAAAAAYYLTAGVFVSANLAILYAALGLCGALAVVFHRYIFAVLFYIGCALGWATGHYIGTLSGDFAPTAGVIATFFLIGCFALIGFTLEVRRVRRSLRKKAEQKEADRLAEEQRQKAVIAEQEAKAKAQAEACQNDCANSVSQAEQTDQPDPTSMVN
jgi:F0F1-type ATP synthase assembly protein I